MDFPLFAATFSYPFCLHDARVVQASVQEDPQQTLRLILSIYDDWETKTGKYFTYTLDFVNASPIDLSSLDNGDIYSESLTIEDGRVTVELQMNGGDVIRFSCSAIVEISSTEVQS